jgi:hypothetical protein
VNIISTLASISSWLSVTSSADACDAKWEERISESTRFPGAQNNTHLREADPESAEGLNEFCIAERIFWLEVSCSGSQARQTNGKRRFPAGSVKVFKVSGKSK